MKVRFEWAVLAITLAFSGCRQEKSVLQPKRADSMKIGELEITVSLNRDGSPYSSQEDILLQFRFENHSDSAASAPMVGIHRATWKLKGPSPGDDKTLNWTPAPQPGTPNFQDDPEVSLEPGQTWTASLPIQDYLGFFRNGKYSLRFELKSSKFPIVTDWTDFEVLGQSVGAGSITPSTLGEARYLLHAWVDLDPTPARILFRKPFIGKQRPLPHRTMVIGEGESNSIPHGAAAPPGVEPAITFVGWMVGDSLKLSRIKPDNSVSNRAVQTPIKRGSIRGPLLTYSDKLGDKGGRISGLLLADEGSVKRLHLFGMSAGMPPVWQQPLPLKAGEVLAMRLVPISPTLRTVLWIRRASNEILVECMAWDDSQPPASPLQLAAIPGDKAVFGSLGANLIGNTLKWSIALHDSNAKEEDRKIKILSHGYKPFENRTAAGIPTISTYAAQSGPIQIQVEVDSQGTPWVLQRDVHGAWVQSTEWPDPIAIETPRGSSKERLFFRRGTLPRILLLDPDAGFQIKPVPFPTGDFEEDVIDDNQ